MTLSPGDRLGPYEVAGSLGAGGMGEVYRARDRRLSREVALKVLPAEVSEDRNRLKRFEREAMAASALNHPNIVTIYDTGSADSLSYIAMERVEGKTLRELLVGGALSIKKLLQISTQIADGLARAHEVGIVHRDLKPENVMVTKDGLVKILDFGLAKLTGSSAGGGSGEGATQTGTSPGMAVGTVGYMSPEQASGEAVDFRSDQFSFGSILYEMATGRRAFHKKTGVDTLAAVLNDEPEPIGQINPAAPAPLRWIVERCHAKEPEDRYLSTGDLARDLASLRDHLSEASGAVAAAATPISRRLSRSWPILLALGVLAGIGIGVTASRRSREEPPLYRQLTFRHGYLRSARFAPDGETIVYAAAWEGKPAQLFMTRADSSESTALQLPGADILSISSTGKIAINLERQPTADSAGGSSLAEVSLAGGAPREILENVSDADWSPDGKNLAIVRTVAGRQRLEFPIGKVLYQSPNGYLGSPRFSPDGKSIAFVESSPTWSAEQAITLVDLAGRKTTLSPGWEYTFGLTWHPRNGEVWFSAREHQGGKGFHSLHAVSRAGRHRLVARAPGGLIVKDISRDGLVLLAQSKFAQSTVCMPPGATKEVDLSWHDLSELMDFSDDGKTMLLVDVGQSAGATGAIYLRKTDGSPAVRLGEGVEAALSPDAKSVVTIPSSRDRLVVLPTGPGEPKVLRARGMSYAAVKWFPDGKRILFSASASARPVRLYVQEVAGGAPRPLTPEGFEGGPISPDGKLIATHDPNGRLVLYPVDGGEPRPVTGVRADEGVIRWDAKGEALFLANDAPLPARVERLVLSTGRREFVREIAPADPSGVGGATVMLSSDGKSYAYWYLRELSDLFVVEGLR